MLELKRRIRELLPRPLLTAYRSGRAAISRWRYRGDRYHCNICNSHLRAWIHAGPVEHRNRVCPVCHSYGRHRFMAMVLARELSAALPGPGMMLLHFAPELGLGRWLREHFPALTYRSADLCSSEVDFRLDVQRMDLPDESIDIVLLSHVLEHVDDDMQALREVHRVLTRGGRLFVQVPLSGEQVTHDEKLATAELRLARYGKTDHVRLYGDDLEKRLSSAGFDVTVHRANDASFGRDLDSMALDIPPDSTMLYDNESSVFVCRKANQQLRP